MRPSSDVTTGFLVWRLSMKWRAAVDRALAPLGLTHAQFALLGSLARLASTGARPSQRELASYAGLEPIYVSKLARALERAGLVHRTGNPADPRAVQLALTDQGADTVRRAAGTVRALQEELTAPIGGLRGDRNRELVDILLALLGPTARAPDDGSQPMSQAPPLTGQDIGAAANATRALLDVLLDRERVSFPEWVALRAVATGGPPVARDTLRSDLVGLLGAEPSSIDELLEGLAARELTREGGADGGTVGVDLTTEGRARFERLTEGIADVAGRLYGDLDPDELAATRRVLVEVTERARRLRTRR